ncbi:MAG TPA: hypothetical protein VGI29_06530 [Candidatus Binataceae bacterium]
MSAIGGSLMFASMMLFFVIVVMTVVAGRKTQPGDLPFTATVQPPPTAGWQPRLDRLSVWVLASVALSIAVYGAFLIAHFPPNLASTGLLYP